MDDYERQDDPTLSGERLADGHSDGTAWKTEAGETYQEWHETKLANATPVNGTGEDL